MTKRECRYLQGGHIEIRWDWSVGLGAPLGDGHTEKLIFFFSWWFFLGKAESVTLLGFERAVNPQNLMNFVRANFEKIEILQFFPMWTTLKCKGRSKTKNNGYKYLQGAISKLDEIGQLA